MEHQGSPPSVPPRPERPPTAAASPLADWLRMPRPTDAPLGVWRAGYEPRPAEEPDRTPTRRIAAGVVVSALTAWLVWSLLWNGYLGKYWIWPLLVLMPDSWFGTYAYVVSAWLYYGIVLGGLLVVAARVGQWPEAFRRTVAWCSRAGGTTAAVPHQRTPAPPPEDDPASFCDLRRDGAVAEADRLTADLYTGALSDIDVGRITGTWTAVRSDERRRAAFLEEIRLRGGGAAPHGSGARNLPQRSAHYDVLARQVRIGWAADVARNPYPYRSAGLALDPGLLGTGLLVVGPSGAGKTRGVVRPVVEALCAQALMGQAAVVVVTDRADACAPSGWFDVVLRAGDEGDTALDLFGGTEDPDEAAVIAAEALVGDLGNSLPGGDSRPAATLLAQLIGPWRAVHGRWPDIEELRDLLDGGEVLDELRATMEAKGLRTRELAAGARQMASGTTTAHHVADRVALLDRPALAGLISTTAGVSVLDRLDRPVRVRVDLPDRVHTEAGRIMTRLVLAKYAAAAPRRGGTSDVCLVLDDATAAITPQSLQSLQRLRSARCGVVLAVRALSDVPEALRGPLVSAVGCRVVCAGVVPWDASHFSQAWGTEWVESVRVTDRQLVADEPVRKLMYGLRRLATGKHVTAQSTTRWTERRQRWPAEDLATEVPGGHAVVSVTAATGDRSSPILVKLGT